MNKIRQLLYQAKGNLIISCGIWIYELISANFVYNFSGAGKTASAKFIMRYFASVDDKDRSQDVKKSNATTSGMSEVEEQIMGMMITDPYQ